MNRDKPTDRAAIVAVLAFLIVVWESVISAAVVMLGWPGG